MTLKPTGKDTHLRLARAVDLSIVRVVNERAVFTEIALAPGSSAAEIAKELGLGPQTVGAIVNDLESRGMVYRTEVRRGSRGKPATPLFMADDGAFAIGCKLGPRHCEMLLVNIKGEKLARHRWDYRSQNAATLTKEIISVIDLFRNVIPASARSKLSGLALVVPAHMARVNLAPAGVEMARWDVDEIKGQLEAGSGLRVTVYNDGPAACWAELAAMPKPRPGSFLCFVISTFVTAGFVSGGRLWEGAAHAADPGLIMIEHEGRTEFLHSIAGLAALEARLAEAGLDVPQGDPMEWDWGALEPALGEWLDVSGRAVAIAISNSAAQVGADMALIDATFPRAVLERYRDNVERHLASLPKAAGLPRTVSLGEAGPSAACYGAAILLLFRANFSGEWEHLRQT